MARRTARGAVGGTVVLDANGVRKAAAMSQREQAILTSARNRDARVVVSAVTLAEVLRDTPRDAPTHRVLNQVTQLPVTVAIGRAAGALLTVAGLADAAIDAIVVATALGQPGPVLMVTSDPHDLARLAQGRADLAIAVV